MALNFNVFGVSRQLFSVENLQKLIVHHLPKEETRDRPLRSAG